jgi:hypothetical protein
MVRIKRHEKEREMFELTPWSLFQNLIFSSGYIYDTRWKCYTLILQVSAEAAILNWNLDYRITHNVLCINLKW